MPIALEFEGGGGCLRGSGTITSKELYDAVAEYYSDRRSIDVGWEIFDCRAVEELMIEDGDLKLLSAHSIRRTFINGRTKKMALVGSNPKLVPLFATFKSIRDQEPGDLAEVRIFESLEDALAWIKPVGFQSTSG